MKRTAAAHQQGAILAFALLLLLALTLLGMIGIRTTLLQGETARYHLEKRLAFENAEIALREGEIRLMVDSPRIDGKISWTPTETPFNDDLPRPAYRLEPLRSSNKRCDGRFFRITARAKTGGGNSLVSLQSIFYIGKQPAPNCRTGRIAWTQLK